MPTSGDRGDDRALEIYVTHVAAMLSRRDGPPASGGSPTPRGAYVGVATRHGRGHAAIIPVELHEPADWFGLRNLQLDSRLLRVPRDFFALPEGDQVAFLLAYARAYHTPEPDGNGHRDDDPLDLSDERC